MNLYMVTLEWDADKAVFIVAKSEDEARDMVQQMFYWMPEYYNDWIVYEIPKAPLIVYSEAVLSGKTPAIRKQMRVNSLTHELKPIGSEL